jgi:hypothetical protein
MILKSAFIKKIRALGYRHRSQQARTHLYRKDGGTHYIFVRERHFLTDDFVKGALGQAGLSADEIKNFMDGSRAETASALTGSEEARD